MNTHALVCFKTVADIKHFTKAADALFLTQSALSKIVHKLEVELEITLFKKQGRNVVLTQAGELFYKRVTRALNEIEIGITEAKRQEEIENLTIFIAAIFSLYAVHLPEKILTFRRQYPNCRFSIEYKYTSAILRDVVNEYCEIGICGDFPTDKEFSGIGKHLLFREPATFVVGKNHHLADRVTVSVEELKEEPFVIWNRSQLGTNKVIIELCKSHGFEPNFAIEAFNDYGVLNAVAMGEGVALVPTTGIINLSEVVPIQLDEDYPLARDIFLAWQKKKKLSPMAAEFKDMLISTAVTD
jgi:DNA-binding transcriptional LysR family regulator